MNNKKNIADVTCSAINTEKTAFTNEQKEFLQSFPTSLIDRDDFDADIVLKTVSSPEIDSNHEVYINENDDFDENEDWDGEAKKECEVKEISLYDHKLTREDNFADCNTKYVLFKVDRNGEFGVADKDNVIPCPQTKCVVNLSTIEDYAEEFTFMPVAYSSFMGVELLNFKRYNSDFFTCDERVFFIALLVKYKSFNFKSFYWSKEEIFKDVGIKKDRVNKIIKKFSQLGILSTELVKTQINGRPMQITYFDIIGGEIIDLLPKILHEDDEFNMSNDIEKYLKPAIKIEEQSLTNIMQ